jgi:hypothetical protein
MMVKYTFCLLIIALLFSCKRDDSAVPERVIRITVKNTEAGSLDLGGFGDEEGAKITRQASHFEISQIVRITNGGVEYQYKPKAQFRGTDSTVIEVYRGSDGVTPSKLSEVVKVIFTVTD